MRAGIEERRKHARRRQDEDKRWRMVIPGVIHGVEVEVPPEEFERNVSEGILEAELDEALLGFDRAAGILVMA